MLKGLKLVDLTGTLESDCSYSQTFLIWTPKGQSEVSIFRWPYTVYTCTFADAIQCAHKDCRKQTCCQ